MLKYYNIISQLSDNEKIRLLTDISSLSNKEYRVLGIPEIRIGTIEAFCRGRFPSPIALANTWDTELLGSLSDSVFKRMAENNIGLATVPSPKIKINPYRAALSEDPFLSSSITREFLKGAERIGTSAAMSGISMHADEAEWIDVPADERFVNEFIVKPFCDASLSLGSPSVLSEPDINVKGLETINSKLASRATSGEFAKGAITICRKVSSEKTVAHIASGGLCFEGSALALESALARYKQIRKSIDHGGHTVEELNIETAHHRAISPETIDNAVDKLIDFAFSVKKKPQLFTSSPDEAISLRAIRESAVLLKNNNSILPIKKKKKISIVGDIAVSRFENPADPSASLSRTLSDKGFNVCGIARGYDLTAERSENLIPEALTLADNSDVVLLFLGLGAEREKSTVAMKKISLPANQLELLDRLASQKGKIVAILPPEHTPDIAMPENCSAILLAPLDTEYSARAIAEIVAGEANPSGKLASTLYTNTEKCYSDYKTRRMRDGIRVGPFIGYRYYDTVGDYPLFPFGHGLSYTSFSYSKLSVSKNTVSFTVKNDTKRPGAEIAQVYIGAENSSVLNPRKQLCGFARVELGAGERKTVKIPLKLPEIYDTESRSFITEASNYTVYVGSSVADIRLTQKIRGGKDKIADDGKRLVDYIHSESNIISDNFKLEAKIRKMKRSALNFVAGAIVLAMALALKLYCLFSGEIALFFDLFAAALGVTGLIFFIAEAITISRIQSRERKMIDEESRKLFNDAEEIAEYNAEAMFVKEFDAEESETAIAVDEQEEAADSEYLSYIDKTHTFETAAREFEIFAAERGCKFAPDVVKKVFASIAASRLIVVTGIDNASFKNFMILLSNYFGTHVSIDKTDASYLSSDSLLFKADAQGNKSKTNCLLALEAARNSAHIIHLAGLTNVSCADLPLYFSAYVNYIRNPRGRHHVNAYNENNAEVSYFIPQNLWFVLNLADGETPDKLPDFIAEVASVNRFAFDRCEGSDTHTKIHSFSYYQLDYLSGRVASGVSVNEDDWKKVDRLEEYVKGLTEFDIGNRRWLALEKYACVYIACKGDAGEALDEAVSAKLVPAVVALIENAPQPADKPLEDIMESIFGEEKANACRRMIKLCSKSHA
ncbi:MAG: glycoside hydrolase family 3 C-terminal domain-containing protein [Clostridia bacterium]|nr:glycoside hydrolase family 3 C-terminal domain-containing protein [Clostridia bacterium]